MENIFSFSDCVLSLFFFLRRRLHFPWRRYRYKRNGLRLDIKEKKNGVLEILIIENNSVCTIGYCSVIDENERRSINFLLELRGTSRYGPYDYTGQEVSKGIYDIIIRKYNPDCFKASYADDNKSSFRHYYFNVERNIRKACEQTPNGKVVTKRGFRFNELRSRFRAPDSMNVYWDKISCKFM